MTAPPASDVKGSHSDEINHPRHYNIHPSGIECVEFAELLPGNLSHVCVYVWRHTHKGTPEKDLKKALWFLARELGRSGAEAHESYTHLGIKRVEGPALLNWSSVRTRAEDRLRGLQPFIKKREFVALVVAALFQYDLEAAKRLITHQLKELGFTEDAAP